MLRFDKKGIIQVEQFNDNGTTKYKYYGTNNIINTFDDLYLYYEPDLDQYFCKHATNDSLVSASTFNITYTQSPSGYQSNISLEYLSSTSLILYPDEQELDFNTIIISNGIMATVGYREQVTTYTIEKTDPDLLAESDKYSSNYLNLLTTKLNNQE